MPPRDPKPANRRRKSKPKLDMPETELAEMPPPVPRPTPARFHPASHPNQGQLNQAVTRTYYLKNPKGAQCQAPREARNRP